MKKQLMAVGLAAALSFSAVTLLSGCGKQYESDKFTTITWPDSKLAKTLPTPESTIGKIETDREDYLEVYIGKTTADQYESFVSSCKEKGFTEKYDSGIDYFDCPYYRAENSDGYRLELEYHKEDQKSSYRPVKETMYIELRAPSEKDDEEATTEQPTEKETEKPTEQPTEKETEKPAEKPKESSESSKADSASFRETMDSYEAFFDEYVDFMKRYKENPSDLTMIAEYSEMMTKYLDYMEKLESIDEDELSTADALYYAEVNARISKKLMEVA